MFLSSLIEELCTKEENNKAGCTLTFGRKCRLFGRYEDLSDNCIFHLNTIIKITSLFRVSFI